MSSNQTTRADPGDGNSLVEEILFWMLAIPVGLITLLWYTIVTNPGIKRKLEKAKHE